MTQGQLEEETAPLSRRKGKLRHLDLTQKAEAAYMVLAEGEKQVDVARHFRVSACVVNKLVNSVRKNPNVLSELLMIQSNQK